MAQFCCRVASIQQYQRPFARFLSAWWADKTDGPLRAELTAAAVVTAHDHVLRRWLRQEADRPEGRTGTPSAQRRLTFPRGLSELDLESSHPGVQRGPADPEVLRRMGLVAVVLREGVDDRRPFGPLPAGEVPGPDGRPIVLR